MNMSYNGVITMTNREWLLKEMQNMSDEEIAEKKIEAVICEEQRNKGACEGRICKECRLEWLKREHKEKIKLSDAERVILENLDKKYEWIARDEDDDLFVYKNKPYKGPTDWRELEDEQELSAFNHLFQFIKWEDEAPYNIEELLK